MSYPPLFAVSVALAAFLSQSSSDLEPVDPLQAGSTATNVVGLHELTSMQRAMTEFRYRVFASPDGHRAANARLGWEIEFDGAGALISPRNLDGVFAMHLVRCELDGEPFVASAPSAVRTTGGSLEYEWSPTITEWYRNGIDGFEHGFTVSEPAARPDELRFIVRVSGPLGVSVDPDALGLRLVDDGGATIHTYDGLRVDDARGVSLPARFEHHRLGYSIVADVSTATYPVVVDPVVRTAYLKAVDPDEADELGPVDVYGDRIVVGVPQDDSGAAGVDGDPTDDSLYQSGAAYVFVRKSGGWQVEAYLKSSHPDASDFFGKSVSIWEDTIAVGAPGDDGAPGTDPSDNSMSGTGAIHVFDRIGGAWVQTGYVKANNADSGDALCIVDLHGSTIVAGAPNEESGATGVNGDESDNSVYLAGAAYVFERNGNAWPQQAYLKPPVSEYKENFGRAVAVSGDLVAVGTSQEDSSSQGIGGDPTDDGAPGSGAVFVYSRQGSTWSYEEYIKSAYANGGDLFGWSVSLSGSVLAVGAPGEDSANPADETDNSKSQAGAVFLFERTGGSWAQSHYLKASNVDESDDFGKAVGLHGSMLVVGAPDERSDSDYVDGDQADNLQPGAGAAYLFSRVGADWEQVSYLKAADSDWTDSFGVFVAVHGRTAVVSADYEDGGDGGIGGVGGDPTDDSVSGAGAAYVFEWVGTPAEVVCAGDGVLAPCPCSNETPIGAREGCRNSTGKGARVSASGTSRVANDNLYLHVDQAPPGVYGLFLGGNALIHVPFRDGLLCVGGETDRLHYVSFDAAGTASTWSGLASATNATPGEVGYYQCWFRDPSLGPCGAGSNLTSAVRVNWN